jgi:hypothetical protein
METTEAAAHDPASNRRRTWITNSAPRIKRTRPPPMIAARSAPVKANDVTCVAGMVVALVVVVVVVVFDIDGETVVPNTLEVLAAKFVPVPSKVASKNWPPALRVVLNVTCPPGPIVLVPISTGSVQAALEHEK